MDNRGPSCVAIHIFLEEVADDVILITSIPYSTIIKLLLSRCIVFHQTLESH
jgi:hypothetical protein